MVMQKVKHFIQQNFLDGIWRKLYEELGKYHMHQQQEYAVENFDWSVIGKDVKAIISSL